MKAKERIKERIKRNRYGKMFLELYGFKTAVLAVCSAVINFGFAVGNLVCAFVYGSAWYYAFSAYYFALIIFRLAVVLADNKLGKKYAEDDKKHLLARNRIQLAGGIYLVLVEIAMAVGISLTIIFGRPAKSGEIMAIATAAYAFYKIIMASINLARAKRHGDPVVQSLRNLNFADACMTMASLTVILLATFGKREEARFATVMNSAVGFAACLAVLALAVLMISDALKNIKRLTRN